jgi:hypothetical protein
MFLQRYGGAENEKGKRGEEEGREGTLELLDLLFSLSSSSRLSCQSPSE